MLLLERQKERTAEKYPASPLPGSSQLAPLQAGESLETPKSAAEGEECCGRARGCEVVTVRPREGREVLSLWLVPGAITHSRAPPRRSLSFDVSAEHIEPVCKGRPRTQFFSW